MDTKLHDPFADDDEADAFAASFAPTPKPEVEQPQAKQSAAITAADSVAADQGFTERKRKKKSTFIRSDNFRTGRNVPLTVKARAETGQELEQMTKDHKWVKGQTLQYALDALREKLNDPQDSFWETHNFHGVD
ncbi:hypothetical protein JANAI62_37850 [Jannaschia pagri]|uniref:Stability/partitioning determinant n=1 Tax=Jannaschia pagri TaxID=2829797 RepID=A0ABQ4NRW8_9RHOB|nr:MULTISPECIES: hypothetical protein [unclassified Jannaschia]GIT93353.1 hypothetical protein JANAI61_38110 [Jannaschia sp. AI_61]GIT97162.1 hypothetical protein JANAI62_37850 [Jannaschia sp. AI_62]